MNATASCAVTQKLISRTAHTSVYVFLISRGVFVLILNLLDNPSVVIVSIGVTTTYFCIYYIHDFPDVNDVTYKNGETALEAVSPRCVEQICKPGSVLDDHLSGMPVTRQLKRPNPRGSAGNVIPLLFGLAPGGVCLAGRSPGRRWSLTPPLHPYRLLPAVSFCGTFPRVAPAGRYPAPCPVEPGLSSGAYRTCDHPICSTTNSGLPIVTSQTI